MNPESASSRKLPSPLGGLLLVLRIAGYGIGLYQLIAASVPRGLLIFIVTFLLTAVIALAGRGLVVCVAAYRQRGAPRLFLAAVAGARRLPRRYLGRGTRRWLGTLLERVSILNLAGLVPTFFFISVAPKHFFARLPVVLAGHSRLHGRPVVFLAQIALLSALALAALQWGDALRYEWLWRDSVWVVLIATVTLPITIPLLCLLLFLPSLLWSLPKSHLGNLFRRHKEQVPFNLQLLWVPLSPQVYRRLDYPRYFCSLFYYALYFFVVTLAGFVALTAWIFWMTGPTMNSTLVVKGAVVACIALMARHVIRHYTCLLASASAYTPVRVVKWQTHEAAWLGRQLIRFAEETPPDAALPVADKAVARLLQKLHAALASLQGDLAPIRSGAEHPAALAAEREWMLAASLQPERLVAALSAISFAPEQQALADATSVMLARLGRSPVGTIRPAGAEAAAL